MTPWRSQKLVNFRTGRADRQADHENSARPDTIHIRPLLQARAYHTGAVRLAAEAKVRGRGPDSKVEKVSSHHPFRPERRIWTSKADLQERLRAVMLRPLHPDARYEFSGLDVHLQSAQDEPKEGDSRRVHALWYVADPISMLLQRSRDD